MDSTKLFVIGPTSVFLEMVLGGHYMESIKIEKQSTGNSYGKIVKNLWNKDGIKSFHRGFFPWGFLQVTKGIPLLYAQHTSSNMLEKYKISSTTNSTLSGLFGGFAQAFFMTPAQRMKVLAVTYPNQLNYNTSHLLKEIIKKEGVSTLFKGLTPTIYKRSIDWGIRLYSIDWFARHVYNKERKQMSGSEKLISAAFGGAASSLSMPLDVMITQSQKYKESDSNKKVNFRTHISEFYNKNGLSGFTRGFTFRVIHASWHTVFAYGVAELMYDYFK